MGCAPLALWAGGVSSRAEEWIEMFLYDVLTNQSQVSSRAEEWIEMINAFQTLRSAACLLPRGGVD